MAVVSLPSAFLDEFLLATIAATSADMGKVQLVEPASGTLKIVASCCFGWRFLQFFDTVGAGTGACGIALEQNARVVVENVPESPLFRDTPALSVMLEAHALAVQSTPLVASDGRVIGTISTHRMQPSEFTPAQLAAVDDLVRAAARHVEEAPVAPGTVAWTDARRRVLIDSAHHLITDVQRRLNQYTAPEGRE